MKEEKGALWVKKSKKGETYLSGWLFDERVFIFKNKNKKTPKSPDYNIVFLNEKKSFFQQASDIAMNKAKKEDGVVDVNNVDFASVLKELNKKKIKDIFDGEEF